MFAKFMDGDVASPLGVEEPWPKASPEMTIKPRRASSTIFISCICRLCWLPCCNTTSGSLWSAVASLGIYIWAYSVSSSPTTRLILRISTSPKLVCTKLEPIMLISIHAMAIHNHTRLFFFFIIILLFQFQLPIGRFFFLQNSKSPPTYKNEPFSIACSPPKRGRIYF